MGDEERMAASDFAVIYLRSDPPFDTNYLYRTQLLSLVVEQGTRVVNDPSAVRNFNEKLFICRFLEHTTEILVSANRRQLRDFLHQHQKIVLKPLDSMGGESIFVLTQGDVNTNVIIDSITSGGSRFVMAQRYLAEISAGDKRILIIDGKPTEYCLARLPKEGESRGNLAAGGRGVVQKTSEQNVRIATEIGEYCRRQGLVFVGLDMIGDWVTEINVTSPTCLVELDTYMQGSLSKQLLKMQSAWYD